MLQRHLDSDFVGGAYVFPGERSTTRTGPRPPRRRARCAATPRPAPCWVSSPEAWRSGWRRCGSASRRRVCCSPTRVWGRSARTPWSCPTTPGPAAASPPYGWRSTRGAAFPRRLSRGEGLRLATDRVHYFSHWITPEPAPKRYDTRFFVAALPPGQVPIHDDHETVDTVWVPPRRRAGPGRGRGVRPHLPHRQEPGGHQPFRHERRAARRGGGRGTGPHCVAAGGRRRTRLPHPAPRRPRLRRGIGPGRPRTRASGGP